MCRTSPMLLLSTSLYVKHVIVVININSTSYTRISQSKGQIPTYLPSSTWKHILAVSGGFPAISPLRYSTPLHYPPVHLYIPTHLFIPLEIFSGVQQFLAVQHLWCVQHLCLAVQHLWCVQHLWGGQIFLGVQHFQHYAQSINDVITLGGQRGEADGQGRGDRCPNIFEVCKFFSVCNIFNKRCSRGDLLADRSWSD